MSQSRNRIVANSPQDAAARAASVFTQIVSQAVEARGICHVALAGGVTPRAMYSHLASHATTDEVPWSRVEVFFGDERDVPQDDSDSNFHMAQRSLFDHTPIDWERIHPMRADAADLDAAVAEYEQLIRASLPAGEGGVPQFDLILLGLGTDGHVASLFPGTAGLDEQEKLVTSCHIPVLGRNRMTVTFPLINAARHVLFFVTGDDKAETVKRVVHDGDPTLPASRVTPKNGETHFVLDQAAAKWL